MKNRETLDVGGMIRVHYNCIVKFSVGEKKSGQVSPIIPLNL